MESILFSFWLIRPAMIQALHGIASDIYVGEIHNKPPDRFSGFCMDCKIHAARLICSFRFMEGFEPMACVYIYAPTLNESRLGNDYPKPIALGFLWRLWLVTCLCLH